MKKPTIFLISILLLCTSCASYTQLVVTNSRADIYVNGVYKGQGTAKIKRNGAPRRSSITAKYRNIEIGNITTRRKFTIATAVVGYYTFGIGWFCFWQYPQTVLIPTETLKEGLQTISPWDTKPSNWAD